jgi:hypothetical protein
MVGGVPLKIMMNNHATLEIRINVHDRVKARNPK